MSTTTVMTNPLTTDTINSLVTAYTTEQTTSLVTPLQTKLTKFQNINSAYSVISNKLSTLNDAVKALQVSGSTSAFTSKTGTSSNSNYVGITASGLASASSYTVKVNQIAKNDSIISQTISSTGINTDITAAGTQTFEIVTGNGSGGQNTSHVSVTFADSDFTNGTITNKAVMDKIQTAINSDKAVVLSDSVTGSTESSGSFTLTIGGNAKTITYSAGTYSDVMDSIVTQVNNITGMNAEKVSDGSGGYQLKLTATDTSKSISIGSDTGSLVKELNIATTNEIGASGVVSASAFAPDSGNYQLSLTTKTTGYDNRIVSLSDDSGSKALSTMGINLGTTRQTFAQADSGTTGGTAGYVYATSDLNSKFLFNGLNVTRNSNTVTDLITGVSLQLNSVMQTTDSAVSLTVSTDTSTIQNKLNTFITSFNDLYTYLKTNTAITAGSTSTDSSGTTTTTAATRGTLCGDSTTQALLNLCTTIANSTVSGIDSKQLNSLSRIGITFDTTNGLSIDDSTTLSSAISSNVDQLSNLFNSTNGIATVLNSRITPYIGTGGYLAKTEASVTKSINSISDNITSQQAVVTKKAAAMRTLYLKEEAEYDTIIYMQTNLEQNSSFYSS